MVHQHFMLVPVMTVAENLVLGAEPQQRACCWTTRRRPRACASSRSASASRSTRTRRVEDLGVGAQQRVEILRALFRGAQVLVLDEPTAVLTAQEAQDLFVVLRDAEGRRARRSSSSRTSSTRCSTSPTASPSCGAARRSTRCPTEGATERSLATLMVGRDVLLRVEKADTQAGRAAARRCEGVSARDDRGLPAVHDVSLEVRAGEIVGLAGIDANGQSELIETIMGLRKPDAGTIMVAGRDVTHAGPRDTLDAGVSHIAEDRHRRGLVLEFDLAENLVPARVQARRRSPRRGFLSPEEDGRARAQAAQGVRRARRRPGDARRARCRAATSRRS